MTARRVRAAVTLAAFAAGCNFGSYEPVPVVVVHGQEHVRLAEMTEEGDAWLHEHCAYKGAFATRGEDDAKANAIVRGANFVEPMGEHETTMNGVRIALHTTFTTFYCPAFPPGKSEKTP